MRRRLVFALLLAVWLAPAAHAAQAPWILYTSDWSGALQVYAVDPSGHGRPGQLTVAQSCHRAPPCSFFDPLPSPDGRHVLFWSNLSLTGGAGPHAGLYVARADGSDRRLVGDFPCCGGVVWAPDSSRFAYGTSVVSAEGKRVREFTILGSEPSWSPDWRQLAYVSGTGLRVVRADGSGDHLVPGTAPGDEKPA